MQQIKQSGFSLFEITFAIVLTCLLATAMVIGQNFTICSKVNRLKQDFSSLQTALYETQVSLRPKQGDSFQTASHSPKKNATGINGNRENILENWKSTSGEIFSLWQNVRPTDPATGLGNSDMYVPLALSGKTSSVSEVAHAPITGLRNNHIICSNNIDGKLVKQLDVVMDDGNTASGSMLASKTFGGTSIATDSIATASTYMVCLGV
jgi:hypothetical protein